MAEAVGEGVGVGANGCERVRAGAGGRCSLWTFLPGSGSTNAPPLSVALRSMNVYTLSTYRYQSTVP